MPLLIVPCPYCNQAAKLDSDKLPDQPVSYACPHCEQKVVADKQQLMQQHAAHAEPPATPPAPQRDVAPPAPQQDVAPPAPQQPAAQQDGGVQAVTLPPSPPVDRRFAKIPEGARMPSGVIFGDDPESIEEIRAKFEEMGCDLEPVESAETARQMIVNEKVELCICVASGEVQAPYGPLRPLRDIPPDVRRLTYLALVADNVGTLDGSQAFVHQVNMVLGKFDLPHFEAALYTGLEYHERLFRPYLTALEQRNAI